MKVKVKVFGWITALTLASFAGIAQSAEVPSILSDVSSHDMALIKNAELETVQGAFSFFNQTNNVVQITYVNLSIFNNVIGNNNLVIINMDSDVNVNATTINNSGG